MISVNSQINSSNTEKACHDLVKKAESVKASVLVVACENGSLVRLVAKYRPRQLILVISKNDITIRQLNLSRGIKCYKPIAENQKEIIEEVIEYYKKNYCENHKEKSLILLFAEEDKKMQFKNTTTVIYL
jgi:pyruvate kinase